MPELPEVETIKLQLARVLPGLKIKDIEVRSPKSFIGDKNSLRGAEIKGMRRFGKMLVIDFGNLYSLAIHLKLTGRLIFSKDKNENLEKQNWDVDYPTDKHTQVIITFTSGDKLYFHDVRKFGWIRVFKTQDLEKFPYLEKQGPEFLNGLTIQQFNNILASSYRPVKVVLMDQEKMAGVGNIYANEGLWCAQINPQAKAKELRGSQMAKLFECLEKILKQAIIWKGASDNDYRDAFGGKGEVQKHFRVYNEEGKPCGRCKTPIKKISLGGRGTYYCPKCQPTH